MDKDKTKKVAKEAVKALGVTGASAAIGAAAIPNDYLGYPLQSLAYSDSPLGRYLRPKIMTNDSRWAHDTIVETNPKVGMGLNATISGLGGLAAYGLIKGLKKLDDVRFQRKVTLHNATNNIKVNNS